MEKPKSANPKFLISGCGISYGAGELPTWIKVLKFCGLNINDLTGPGITNGLILNLLIDTGEDDSAADLGASIEIEAGKSFLMGSPHESILVDDDAATVNVSNVALMDLRSIHVDPVSEAVQVEVFIASA